MMNDSVELDDMTCGHCGRTWNSKETPTPAARCPFEYEHEYPEDEAAKVITVMGQIMSANAADAASVHNSLVEHHKADAETLAKALLEIVDVVDSAMVIDRRLLNKVNSLVGAIALAERITNDD